MKSQLPGSRSRAPYSSMSWYVYVLKNVKQQIKRLRVRRCQTLLNPLDVDRARRQMHRLRRFFFWWLNRETRRADVWVQKIDRPPDARGLYSLMPSRKKVLKRTKQVREEASARRDTRQKIPDPSNYLQAVKSGPDSIAVSEGSPAFSLCCLVGGSELSR